MKKTNKTNSREKLFRIFDVRHPILKSIIFSNFILLFGIFLVPGLFFVPFRCTYYESFMYIGSINIWLKLPTLHSFNSTKKMSV